MGHEFTGSVVEVGNEVNDIKVGDTIVSPFTVSCNDCFYCRRGCTSRCTKSLLFGTAALDGAQAEYVRVPLADTTLFRAPKQISEESLVLMADIFPTGYFAAANVLRGLSNELQNSSTTVVLGCGPVGLCAIAAATTMTQRIYAIDSVPSRLQFAEKLGAIPINLNDDPRAKILTVTEGRGADYVLEVVGLSPALRLAFDLVRPWGKVSSVGVHSGEIPFTANEAYNKNVSIQFGRCPVRAIFKHALDVLQQKQGDLSMLIDCFLPLSDAVKGYELFNTMKVQKVIFKCEE